LSRFCILHTEGSALTAVVFYPTLANAMQSSKQWCEFSEQFLPVS